MNAKDVFLIILHFASAYATSQMVLPWSGKCNINKYALNDCNWCVCNSQKQYICTARVCSSVDMFGHFNDAIRDIDVGMEGHGVWRTIETPCEPDVHYQRGDLLCVCTEDGLWPNPVCRDNFQVLHLIEIIPEKHPKNQECEHTSLYLIGCLVCFCPSTGRINSKYCTKKFCKDNDPIVTKSTELEAYTQKDYDMYADCKAGKTYKVGCKNCLCLKNNRLHCDNCTENHVESYCDRLEPGQMFNKGCNLCYCDEDGYSYCTAKKCLNHDKSYKTTNQYSVNIHSEDNPANCIPGKEYKKGCNYCSCYENDGKKELACTLKSCGSQSIHDDCVVDTIYEKNGLLCKCEIDGVKKETCEIKVYDDGQKELKYLHGYCEPLRIYKDECNKCRCLVDGKTLKCTSKICNLEPMSVELIPIVQKGNCPKGSSYKIDCNLCFCLDNGNAICTTTDCGDS